MFGIPGRSPRRFSLLLSSLGILCDLALCRPALAVGEESRDLDGSAIMKKVEESPRGSDLRAQAVWRLISDSGRERIRKTRIYRRQVREQTDVRSQWLIVVDSPPDLKDTAYLVWNPRSASEDSQWIYLAAFRKVRRVAVGDRGASFLGSDFSYADLAEPLAANEDHLLVGSERVGGVSCRVVESLPKRAEDLYAKRVRWVDPSNWTIVRTDYYAKNGSIEKTLHASWEFVDGAWVTPRLEMVRVRPPRRTVVEASGFRIDTGLQADLFDAADLERAARAP